MYPEHQEQSAAEGDLSPVELGVNFTDGTSASNVRAHSQQVIALKFGGTSLLGAERMRHAAGLVREADAAFRGDGCGFCDEGNHRPAFGDRALARAGGAPDRAERSAIRDQLAPGHAA